FSEAAALRSIGWIHIQGKIATQMLSKNTMYEAYLVFWVERMDGLKSSNTVIRFASEQSKSNTSNKRFESRETGKLAKMRADGWVEIALGKFYNGDGDNGEVEAWLTEINSPIGMSGLVVEGIEFRPL
ncbi:F-box protein PP2-B11, partial [Sesamum alatum]